MSGETPPSRPIAMLVKKRVLRVLFQNLSFCSYHKRMKDIIFECTYWLLKPKVPKEHQLPAPEDLERHSNTIVQEPPGQPHGDKKVMKALV